MLTRRSFLKLAGFGTVAAGAGVAAGNLMNSSGSARFYTLYGFLPEDDKAIKGAVSAFKSMLPGQFRNSGVNIIADENYSRLIASQFAKDRGNISIRVKHINSPVLSDIIAADNQNSIYRPENFNIQIASLRNYVRNKEAGLLFSAEFRETNIISNLFGGKYNAVIENENGMMDIIPLDRKPVDVAITGPSGKSIVRIGDGRAAMKSSVCRHRICELHSASLPGNIIACAPNRLMIRIEAA